MYQNSISATPMLFKKSLLQKMNTASRESPLWTSMYKLWTYIQSSLSKEHPKGYFVFASQFVYLTFPFILKVVHSNLTGLSFQQYICICTCTATNPSLCSPLSSAIEVQRKKQAMAGTSLTPTQCPELCYSDWVSGYYSSREMSFLSEYIKSSKYS